MAEKPGVAEIAIYKSPQGPQVQVTFAGDTAWLSLRQMADLFGRDKSVVSRHLKNVFLSGELSRNSVVARHATTAADGKTYQVEYYNLDAIISVGYRINSKRGTQFRIWATSRLKDYLLKGYAVNRQLLDRAKTEQELRIGELRQAVRLFQDIIEAHRAAGYEKDLLSIMVDYTATWTLLHRYDQDSWPTSLGAVRPAKALVKTEVDQAIARFKRRLSERGQAGELFGQEVGEKFSAVLGGINQTYDGRELYPTLEEKAAHLFYFGIKDHPFADGNKRIASLVLLLYLVENRIFTDKRGQRRINDSALAALALLVAESRPEQKSVMISLIAGLLSKR